MLLALIYEAAFPGDIVRMHASMAHLELTEGTGSSAQCATYPLQWQTSNVILAILYGLLLMQTTIYTGT